MFFFWWVQRRVFNKMIEIINKKSVLSDITFSKKEILRVIKNRPHFPECKIQEYIHYKNTSPLKKYYKPIHTKQQLKSLIRISKQECSGYLQPFGVNIAVRLFNLLCRKNSLIQFNPIIHKILNSRYDDDVYTYLRTTFRTNPRCNSTSRIFCSPSVQFAQTIRHILSKVNRKLTTYLDIGCGSGNKTERIAKELGIVPKNTYGVDVYTFDEQGDRWNKQAHRRNMNFKRISEQVAYPFEKHTFDLISAIMVLHHISNIDFVLKEVHRLLRKNGLFIIKEHDCHTCADAMLADVEHCMYNLVYSKKINDTFRRKNYATYFNQIEWDALLLRYGFKYVTSSFTSPSVQFNVGPTRGYVAVYTKI